MLCEQCGQDDALEQDGSPITFAFGTDIAGRLCRSCVTERQVLWDARIAELAARDEKYPMAEYQDRLDPSRYATDEAVSLALTGAPNYGAAFTMPERLFSRAQQIAAAYELHLLPAIDCYGEVQLSKEEVQTLRDELAFIRSVTSDPLLDPILQGAQALMEACLRAPKVVQVVVQGP